MLCLIMSNRHSRFLYGNRMKILPDINRATIVGRYCFSISDGYDFL